MKVVVTDRPFPEPNPYEGLLQETGDLYGKFIDSSKNEIVYAECTSEEQTIQSCSDADVIITFVAPITDRVMDAAGDLKLIIRQGAGYDNIDVKEATKRSIPVSNAPDYGSADVASHGIAMALAAAHDIPSADRRLRKSTGWGSSRVIHPIQGGVYGIVGLGRIGRRAVPMARGLGMDVIAFDPLLDDDIFEQLDVEQVSFDELLERSDCITLHAPLNEETHHLFSTDEFNRMNESAVFVNVARGPLVDEKALVEAVESNQIRAAAIDVFEKEPPTDSPVLECDDIVHSPHHAGSSPEAKERKIKIVGEEMERVLKDKPLQNVVNPEVYQYLDQEVRS
ncbi:C-terminal binding protein [Halovenus salina]|uniref:C-terminal binding protein n=1 Tax=Halovenus salina TaxID=1510225 RepID=A0ABD5VWP6_9EURY|nr:C-terminal binding protein [Halovenus salina]